MKLYEENIYQYNLYQIKSFNYVLFYIFEKDIYIEHKLKFFSKPKYYIKKSNEYELIDKINFKEKSEEFLKKLFYIFELTITE